MMFVRPEYNFKTIGRNLKNLRMANHLSVEQVRAYMQLGSVQAIYKWERGDGLPQADSLFALMRLYGVTDIDRITEESEELSSVFFEYWGRGCVFKKVNIGDGVRIQIELCVQ